MIKFSVSTFQPATTERTDMPAVTVITPFYKSPQLWSSMESVQKQSYPNILHIVVNDGSPVINTEDIARYCEHAVLRHRVLYIDLGSNHGTVYALNQAYRHLEGDVVYSLAADDIFADENVIADWTDAFNATGAQVMTARRILCTPDLRTQLGAYPSEKEIELLKTKDCGIVFESLVYRNYIFGSSTARTVSFVNEYGAYDERYRLVEDYPFNLSTLRKGVPIVFFDRVVIYGRAEGTSAPQNVNTDYINDSQRIYQNEIAPYTKHKHKAHLAFCYWLWKHKRNSRYYSAKARANTRLQKVLVSVQYPESLLRLLKHLHNRSTHINMQVGGEDAR